MQKVDSPPMNSKVLIFASLLGCLLPLHGEEKKITRKNLREVQRDQFYYRVDKTFNTAFYKRHFESDGGNYELLNYLVDTAELYDVSPLGVFGTIMAEHSMNQRSQLKQTGEAGINLLGKTLGEKGEQLANDLNVRFRSASGEATFGPGQIQPSIATAMQDRIRKTRPDATDAELDKYNWKGAINIIAAYMDFAAEEYEKAGFVEEKSIRKDPTVLATLINIGETRKSFAERAVETRELIETGERESPWINYFGYWIYRNERVLSSKLSKATGEESKKRGLVFSRPASD